MSFKLTNNGIKFSGLRYFPYKVGYKSANSVEDTNNEGSEGFRLAGFQGFRLAEYLHKIRVIYNLEIHPLPVILCSISFQER